VQAALLGKPSSPGQWIEKPTPFPFKKFAKVADRHAALFIAYQERFVYTHFFKNFSDDNEEDAGTLVPDEWSVWSCARGTLRYGWT
jgi:hypothetical protein